jgi:hypothetical protein
VNIGRIGEIGMVGSSLRRQSNPTQPPWQQVLTLAQADGWSGLYDPTNPNTLTVSGDNKVAAISDALGTFPDAVQATDANKPILYTGEFGQLDGIGNAASGASTKFLQTTSFTSVSQPYSIVALGKWYDSSAANSALYGNDSTTGIRVLHSGLDDTVSGIGANGGSDTINFGHINFAAHLYAIVWNGSSTKGYFDGGAELTGNCIGASTKWCLLGRGAASPMRGTGSCWLIFNGIVPTDALGRMTTLLLSLSGIGA